jgi:hypothetical protein
MHFVGTTEVVPSRLRNCSLEGADNFKSEHGRDARAHTFVLQRAHFGQELTIGLGLGETLDQKFHRFHW